MASPTMFIKPTLLLLFSLAIFTTARAAVPTSAQFQYVNNGEFGPYIVEYDGSYRMLQVFASPFQLAFYNTTPNAFTLALRMGLTRSESLFRWVWEANRGNPVGENATLTFGANGNLVLADADGRVVWQTNTANKGVVGFTLLPTGNMVLYNSKGAYLWQSFDYPTDTLLVGQSLKVGGVTKLVSRVSESVNADGPYSLVMEPKGLALYYTSNITHKPLLYFNGLTDSSQPNPLSSVTLVADPVNDGFAYEINLNKIVGNESYGSIVLGRPKYNATSSILRLAINGNLEVYTYNDKVDYRAWERTFALFDRANDLVWESECQLPVRCGSLGVCSDNQCVACPSASGLLGWSESCAPPTITSCKASDVTYFKVSGVDHFLSKYNSGSATTESKCGAKCTSDCKCKGYFYNQETSRCLLGYELFTLTKVANSTHVGYIKTPKK